MMPTRSNLLCYVTVRVLHFSAFIIIFSVQHREEKNKQHKTCKEKLGNQQCMAVEADKLLNGLRSQGGWPTVTQAEFLTGLGSDVAVKYKQSLPPISNGQCA